MGKNGNLIHFRWNQLSCGLTTLVVGFCFVLFCSKTVLFNLNVLTIACARSRNHLSAKASVHVHLVTSFRPDVMSNSSIAIW